MVPERDIMLTTVVYHIQLENRKTPVVSQEFFLLHMLFGRCFVTSWVVCSW